MFRLEKGNNKLNTYVDSKKTYDRESKYELLRILAMILIIIHHICMHCIYPQLNDSTLFWKYDNPWYRDPKFYPSLLHLELFATAGKVADEIFLLITGFFMLQKEKIANLDKKIFNLIGQAMFVTAILVVTSFVYNIIIPNTNYQLFSVQNFNTEWWFIGYYILVILIGVFYLNGYLNSLSRENYRLFLIILLAVFSLGWIGNMLTDYANGLRVAVCGVFLYSLGGYIKKFNPYKDIRTCYLVMIILLIYALVFISKYNSAANHITLFKISGGEGDCLPQTTYYEDYNLAPLIVGVIIFEIFRRINIPKSKIVNSIAKATFMMYLIHDNGFVHMIWQQKDWVTLLNYSLKRYLLEIGKQTGSILFVGFLMFYIYEGIIRIMFKRKFKE